MARFQDSADDLDRQGPPTGGGASQAADTDDKPRKLLGVDEKFVATPRVIAPPRTTRDLSPRAAERAGRRATELGLPGQFVQDVRPVFFEGDEDDPGTLPPEQIAKIQQSLINAGLLDPDTRIIPGMWDNATKKSFKLLLEYANRRGFTSWAEALEDFQEFQKQTGLLPDLEGPALPTALPNPEDIRRTMRATALKELGSVTEEQLDILTNTASAAFRAQAEGNAAAEQEALNRGQQFFTAAPTPDESAIIEERFPAQVAGTRIRDAETEFFDLLTRSGPQIG